MGETLITINPLQKEAEAAAKAGAKEPRKMSGADARTAPSPPSFGRKLQTNWTIRSGNCIRCDRWIGSRWIGTAPCTPVHTAALPLWDSPYSTLCVFTCTELTHGQTGRRTSVLNGKKEKEHLVASRLTHAHAATAKATGHYTLQSFKSSCDPSVLRLVRVKRRHVNLEPVCAQ